LLLGLVGVARLGGARVGYAGVGVGPLGSRPSRALVRRLLRLADAVLVRDARSARLCRALGVRNSVVEGLDLALLLPPPVALPTAGVACLTLGVSVIPYFREFEREEASDARVVESLSHALARLACETSFRVVVLPFFDPPGDVERGDRAMSERLAARLTRDSVDASLGGSSVEQVRAAISDCDVLLATRYHAALLAYVAAKPAVVVTYDAKCSSLADQLGVPPRARLSPRELLDTTLVETRLRALLRAPSDFEATLPLEEARARTETALSAFVSALTSDAEPR
jgi:polysaccharide pyruvyl transferase WcaK-like protein